MLPCTSTIVWITPCVPYGTFSWRCGPLWRFLKMDGDRMAADQDPINLCGMSRTSHGVILVSPALPESAKGVCNQIFLKQCHRWFLSKWRCGESDVFCRAHPQPHLSATKTVPVVRCPRHSCWKNGRPPHQRACFHCPTSNPLNRYGINGKLPTPQVPSFWKAICSTCPGCCMLVAWWNGASAVWQGLQPLFRPFTSPASKHRLHLPGQVLC